MTSFNPTLLIKRLQVTSGPNIVYDEPFHAGLNIIRGENSSGKSTILDFLFYALGGDLTDWRDIAQKCDRVFLEVALNGRVATLSREISSQKLRPMAIIALPFDEARNSPMQEWKLYPYSRAANKESFSQIILRWLGIPEVAGDAEGKITIHQILRLIYADQMSPVDSIFKFEHRDTPLIRQTVGDLLCGGYDNDLYNSELKIRAASKQFEEVNSELSSIMRVLGKTGHPLTHTWISGERTKLEDELFKVQHEIEELEKRIFLGEVSDGLSTAEQDNSYGTLVEIQTKLAAAKKSRDELNFEIADSSKYLGDLEAKLASIQDASLTQETLADIAFIYCPSCLAPLEKDSLHHACSLCKSPYGEENAKSRMLGLINDIGEQIRQSNFLQEHRSTELRQIELEIVRLKALWDVENRKYQLANRTPSTELRSNAKALHRRAGALEQELLDLTGKGSLVQRIGDLSDDKARLQALISQLASYIAAKKIEQSNSLNKAYSRIAENTRQLLQKDLDRQTTFKHAERVDFSFGDNKLSVNGESFFSASSMVYFKNSFLSAFLESALQDSKFRHPRLLLLDTIEDKGIEPQRSHHFQMLLKAISDASPVEHQIIYATSMIAPELKDSDCVVGRYYTHEARSLTVTSD